MKTLLKLLVLLGLGLYLKMHFIDPPDLRKLDLLPLSLNFAQGPSPEDGGPMIIECWGTTSGLSVESISHLNELYGQFRARGLGVVGITTESVATVEAFLRGTRIDYAVAVDPEGRYAKAMNVRHIPTAFLVNRDGKVVWHGNPMALEGADVERLAVGEVRSKNYPASRGITKTGARFGVRSLDTAFASMRARDLQRWLELEINARLETKAASSRSIPHSRPPQQPRSCGYEITLSDLSCVAKIGIGFGRSEVRRE